MARFSKGTVPNKTKWPDSGREPCQTRRNGPIQEENRAKTNEMARFSKGTVPKSAKWPDSAREPCQSKQNCPIQQ
ncbi:hypothetical protein BHU61_08725 [Macrococcus epidermidis]|uniref:Uncharacterized protein n=1 Tax=Macrococcus epidermidis TaxID=1902580 RepID=A0A327ZTE9_9STAP|nr:hypothetical protein BHU61_08725 [Macrococcus epidermidis]